jgi:hypothetical protein
MDFSAGIEPDLLVSSQTRILEGGAFLPSEGAAKRGVPQPGRLSAELVKKPARLRTRREMRERSPSTFTTG